LIAKSTSRGSSAGFAGAIEFWGEASEGAVAPEARL